MTFKQQAKRRNETISKYLIFAYLFLVVIKIAF